MKGLRNRSILAVLAAAMLVLSCGRVETGAIGQDAGRAVSEGRAYAEALVAKARAEESLSTEAVVALGYLERLRLGLGSPFRLMDQALQDPRLDDSTRVQTTRALLARTLDGQAYRIDAAALDRVGLAGIGYRSGVGVQHLELIESAVREARDPRSGELAVRLAYALAAAERSVGRRAPELAAQAAALVRDREIARKDAERLVRAAEATGRDPLTLISSWREERRFQVEQPLLTTLPLRAEHEAIELAPRLATAIQGLALRLTDAGDRDGRAREVPILGRTAASRLVEIAETFDAPPQTPVVIAVGLYRNELLRYARDEASREARRRFIERATNEERFAAELAMAADGGPVGGTLSRVALAAAVGLRPYAQERVWFPGYGAPSTRELEDRYGLASVDFEGVDARWRPYYRRMLDEALTDMQRVLPSLDLRGLTVRFAASQTKAATLAIHDPRQRAIYLPPETGAGTIAHEVAHDLDWQVALRRFRVRGDYGSDRATRRGDDRLAASLRRLTTATLAPPVPGDSTPPMHASRPAEVFARSLDWFVVVSLAREGRMNGYLSSVQDDLLTGYGTVLPPDITGTAGLALVSILDEVAPVYPETREAFLRGYGPFRSLTAYDLVRQVVESELPEGLAELPEIAPIVPDSVAAESEEAEGDVEDVDFTALPTPYLAAAGVISEAFEALERARDEALAAIDAWACQLPAAAYDRNLEIARRRLVARTANARARGLALHYAQEIAGEEGRSWLAHRFAGVPSGAGRADDPTTMLLKELIARAEAAGEVRVQPEDTPLGWTLAPRACATNGPLSLSLP